MAKSRFSLGETMSDAVERISAAKEEHIETSLNENPEVHEVSESEHLDKDKKVNNEDTIVSQKINKLRKRICKPSKNSVYRNTCLDEDVLFKFEDLKNKINRCRNKENGDAFVTLQDLLTLACVEFIDKNYSSIIGD